ncbi:hypothetical protein LDJ79_08360 [Vibrio tritonius]|uniref:Phage-related membrane protein n=1 Tax=Vibrio tritonius TaxID=1435069 RepID=A0ABS7YKD4_9VIBR|nr:hypothetical protein [Vibrio tritonius]MCA2016120.1 hypothetical protein [Vibrio tritonius]
MNIDTLELYKSIRESMTNVTIDGNDVSGLVNFNAELVDKLKRLNEAMLCSASFTVYKDDTRKTDLTVNSEISDKHYEMCNRAKIELSKQSSQGNNYFICSTWTDVINYTDYLLNPVKAVYISDINKILTKDSKDKNFSAYLNVSKVCNLVKDVAHTSKGNSYTVLCGQPLDIILSIDNSALTAEIDISFLDELLGKDQHKEAINSLVREALYNLLSDLNPKSRLSHLINNFNAFTSKLLVSYEQYVRNYSFDKVRKEYQEKATEYIDKINKVFDAVATKTFAIPLGVWFAASQIQTTKSIDSLQFFKNLSYCVMVTFLVVIICWNLLGQFSTLKSTVKEYTDLFERLGNELKSDQKTELDTLKNDLDTRKKRVFWKLVATMVFAIILLGFTILVAYKALAISELLTNK